jgi:heme-degrading monooxygenase HmoA
LQTVRASEADFVAWTKSENFRNAHRSAGTSKVHDLGQSQFEGFSVVEGA